MSTKKDTQTAAKVSRRALALGGMTAAALLLSSGTCHPATVAPDATPAPSGLLEQLTAYLDQHTGAFHADPDYRLEWEAPSEGDEPGHRYDGRHRTPCANFAEHRTDCTTEEARQLLPLALKRRTDPRPVPYLERDGFTEGRAITAYRAAVKSNLTLKDAVIVEDFAHYVKTGKRLPCGYDNPELIADAKADGLDDEWLEEQRRQWREAYALTAAAAREFFA